MKITKAADFAIRLLSHLAAGEAPTTSQALSRELGIPYAHLAKLVQAMARSGFVATKKGKGGGLKLAADPKKVNLAEVIEAVEGPVMISDCLFNKQSCCFSGKCKVRKCLGAVRNTINQMLKTTSIHDVALQYN